MEPINPKSMNTKTISVHDCLYVISFFSHKELVTKPRAKNTVAVMKSAIVAEVSLGKKNDAIMGMIISIPDTCRTKPMLASNTAIVFGDDID
jgi:hypothetical protein